MSIDRTAQAWLRTAAKTGGHWLRLGIILPVLSGALLLVQAYWLSQIIHRAIVEGDGLTVLTPMIILVGAVLSMRIGLALLGDLAAIRGGEAIKQKLRADMLASVLDVREANERRAGVVASTLIDQSEALDGYFVRYLPAMTQAAILPLGFAIVLMPVDWVVGLLFFMTAPLIPVFMALAGLGAEAASKAQAGALSRLGGRFADRLAGLTTLKLLGREAREIAAIRTASEDLRDRTMAVLRIAFLSSAVLEFFAALGVAGTALYIGLSLLDLIAVPATGLTLASGLFCLLMAPEIYQPLRLLAVHYHDRAAARAAAAAIAQTFDMLVPQAVAYTTISVDRQKPFAASLSVSALTIRKGTTAIGPLDLVVRQGEHVALLGASGIGKSSVLDALARLVPYTGQIAIAGDDLQGLSEARLRRDIGVLSQNPHIFAGTVADNIRLGRLGACDTAVRAAARRAEVLPFADHLPQGLATRLGEGGVGLSGGEVQRIALARLYLRNPNLLLLDEPTSHLDAATEARVIDALMDFARGRTMVIATHSRAVAARMDRACRLTAGGLLPALRPSLPALNEAAA